MAGAATGKQPLSGMGTLPIVPKYIEEFRRQHSIPVFATFTRRASRASIYVAARDLRDFCRRASSLPGLVSQLQDSERRGGHESVPPHRAGDRFPAG
jgi:hypothetical protein